MHDGTAPRRRRASGAFWRVFERLDRYASWLGWIGHGVAAAFIGMLFLFLIAGVFSRPWNDFVFSFAFETTSMMMWPVGFLALASIWRTHGHVRFDLLLRITRGRGHHLLELLSSIAALVIGVLIAWQGWNSVESQYRSGGATMVFLYPIWPLHSAVFIGGCILVLELLCSVFRSLREIVDPTGSEEAIYGTSRDPSNVL